MAKVPGPDPEKTAYRCQATEITRAGGPPWRLREVGQHRKDVRDWGLLKVIRVMAVELFNVWQGFSHRRLPSALRLLGGHRYPYLQGPLKKGETPAETLDLQPGELVRIKSKDEILATLDDTNHNRGLSFDGEMAKSCGRVARVRSRVSRLIDERSGEMIDIKSDCIILEGVVCPADYHRLCTRGIYSFWREIWLERVDEPAFVGASAGPCSHL